MQFNFRACLYYLWRPEVNGGAGLRARPLTNKPQFDSKSGLLTQAAFQAFIQFTLT